MSVTAIVVHWSSLADLPACLDALGSHPGLEVVVVDNASPDGGEDLVRRRYPTVRWVPMGRNVGFGSAVNAGVAATRSEWILAMNPDTTMSGRDVLAMAAAARDLAAAAMGPRIVGRDGRVELSCSTRDSLAGDFGWMLSWRAGRAGKPFVSAREVAWVTGACMLLRRTEFESVGGFDENYFLYFEDADLCRRIRLRGGRVIHDPGFSAVHLRGGSARGQAGPMELVYRRSQMRFVSLHRSVWGRLLVRWSIALRALLLRGPWSPPDARARGIALGEIARGVGRRG